MNNIIECPQCGKTLIGEELAIHQCVGKIVDITYRWYVKTDLDDIGKILFVKATDGTFYRITPQRPPTKRILTDDDTKRWFDSTTLANVYILE